MFRAVVTVFVVSGFVTPAWAQAQPASGAAPTQTTPSAAKPAKKPAPKAKTIAKKQEAVETGPCRLGVISVPVNFFFASRRRHTIFETEVNEVPMDGWGLDDLPLARVRAATDTDPSVRRIAYPKGAFEPYYNPKSR